MCEENRVKYFKIAVVNLLMCTFSPLLLSAMVSALDDAVGKVLDALIDCDMLENTIIVFSTDNGGPAAGFNRNMASNQPLRWVNSVGIDYLLI